MPHYTTGELAGLCNITVRTVQFYDNKGILSPSELTEGGRRLYSEEDLKQMQLICMLKALGLSLTSIKGILESQEPHKVLLLLLDEQERQMILEEKARVRQLEAIRIVRDGIRQQGSIPANSIRGIEDMMKGKKSLRHTRGAMLAIGLVMDVIVFGTLILGVIRGKWLPFALGLPLAILLGFCTIWLYYKTTAYICPACQTVFRPELWKFICSGHTPKARHLQCPHCGAINFCIETAASQLEHG